MIPKKWGDGILRSAGALADDPYWDAIMEEIYQSRKIDRPPQPEGMTHLLDTDTCSAHMRRPAGLAR